MQRPEITDVTYIFRWYPAKPFLLNLLHAHSGPSGRIISHEQIYCEHFPPLSIRFRLKFTSNQTYHTLHEGRAEYTLIIPPHTVANPTDTPKVSRHIIGYNISAGETPLLIVESGIWKKSMLLPQDLEQVEGDAEAGAGTYCLITEVVIPAFEWEDHKYMTMQDLEGLFSGAQEDKERTAIVEEFRKYLKKVDVLC
jgi:predicted cupin superfamily sugar epimerase